MSSRGSQHRAFTLIELGLVMALIAVMAAIMFPVFSNAQHAATKSQCQDHLYQIGLALQLYGRDHDGKLPHRHNDLRPLVDGYLSDLTVLECGKDAAAPAVRRANETGAKAVRAYSSYQYRGGWSSDDRPDLPVAADWMLIHDGGANLLMLDGSVKWFRTPNLPPVSFGPRVLPPGVASPVTLDPPTPYVNDPPAAPDAGSGLGEGGE